MDLSSYGFCTVRSRGGCMEAGQAELLLEARQGKQPLCSSDRNGQSRGSENEHFGTVQTHSVFSKAEVVEELGVEEKSSEVSLISS